MDGWSGREVDVSNWVSMREWGADPRKPMTLIIGFINGYYAILYAVMA